MKQEGGPEGPPLRTTSHFLPLTLRYLPMDIAVSYVFSAPPERVWNLLMDPETIKSCIPGCERLDPDGEDRYRATLTVALAAITGTYSGTVVIADKVPHSSYRLVAEGQGRPGFIKANSLIALRADS